MRVTCRRNLDNDHELVAGYSVKLGGVLKRHHGSVHLACKGPQGACLAPTHVPVRTDTFAPQGEADEACVYTSRIFARSSLARWRLHRMARLGLGFGALKGGTVLWYPSLRRASRLNMSPRYVHTPFPTPSHDIQPCATPPHLLFVPYIKTQNDEGPQVHSWPLLLGSRPTYWLLYLWLEEQYISFL
ncbi:hypothetical protein PHLGIDRAFT_429030 [Phlebiopsis gigantea 11061_1 CR5-6]|uniref:Uncharacterized protein n=1 Tax=Phlebiopsis gigantea (strain 11061_1 CR5-6) TaxID=745531 RepID=A0A0C3S865_PHLG1|nr:hypothetical protein PHLGIDRAFT_429030 [Phlebiopsis gigantea 11061_1 CR5-6]